MMEHICHYLHLKIVGAPSDDLVYVAMTITPTFLVMQIAWCKIWTALFRYQKTWLLPK